MNRTGQSVVRVVQLQQGEDVKVRHPSLEGHPQHLRYEALFPDGCGPLFTVDCGTKARAFAFLNATKLLVQSSAVGDNRTTGFHLASTVFRDLEEEERAKMGVTDGSVCISVGLESPVAIAEDLLNAWRTAMVAKSKNFGILK
jgi:O-acetylhomoserine/O-acetylserine sulfhydrylase-like pyridoxal-dependent enzyme